MTTSTFVDIGLREAAESEVKRAVNNVFSDELSQEAKELIIHCPHIVNKLAAGLNNMIDNFADNEMEISHVEYTAAQMGYEK